MVYTFKVIDLKCFLHTLKLCLFFVFKALSFCIIITSGVFCHYTPKEQTLNILEKFLVEINYQYCFKHNTYYINRLHTKIVS